MGSPMFLQQLFHRRHVQYPIDDDPFELDVRSFQLWEPLRIRRLHAADLLPPSVESRPAHAVAVAVAVVEVIHLRPGLIVLQHRDDLLFTEPAVLHRNFPLHPFKGGNSQLAMVRKAG
jgi:hypothetical protein